MRNENNVELWPERNFLRIVQHGYPLNNGPPLTIPMK